MQNQTSHPPRGSDRRRTDWQQNDRRQTWPWVMDSNDRRSGEDRRVLERRARENRERQNSADTKVESEPQTARRANQKPL